ncbi:MAG: hypothetical protein JNN08_01850 [Bryobacterales bacterium]|nr:hypothetical protein [Bryobacterales bacterium]
MRQPLGEITGEEEYFHELEAELIEKMRARAEKEDRRHCMAEAAHIEDPKIAEALTELGYSPGTVSLLCLAPLVHVAWADGWVRRGERKLILAVAKLHGVIENTAIYNKLVEWLDRSPGEDFFEGSLQVIREIMAKLPESERNARRNVLMHDCRDVAHASGWHLGGIGATERSLIEKLDKLLADRR